MPRLRLVWLSYLAGLGAVSVVVLVLAATGFSGGDLPWLPVAAAVALAGLACRVAPRLVTPADERAGFFLSLAFAEAPVLAGFVGYVLTGSVAPYVVGLAFGLPAMLRAQPAA